MKARESRQPGWGPLILCTLLLIAAQLVQSRVARADPISLGTTFKEPLIFANGRAYFTGHEGATGYELWISDGSPQGTHLLTDIFPGPDSAYPFGVSEVNGKIL